MIPNPFLEQCATKSPLQVLVWLLALSIGTAGAVDEDPGNASWHEMIPDRYGCYGSLPPNAQVEWRNIHFFEE
jgi:hypothetical protein